MAKLAGYTNGCVAYVCAQAGIALNGLCAKFWRVALGPPARPHGYRTDSNRIQIVSFAAEQVSVEFDP